MNNICRFLLNVIIILIGIPVSISALVAPYLISVAAQSDSSITLNWRNNDIAATGFLIERRDSSETTYHLIDSVKTATTLSYSDIIRLNPLTLYRYRVKAYSATAVSDSSNHLEARTLASSLHKAALALYWNVDTSQKVSVIIYDSSNCEIGYHIFRGDGNSASLIKIATINSPDPRTRDSIIWIDTTARPNRWYTYRVTAFTAADSLFSDTCVTYTFRDFHSNMVSKFTKTSEFPISVSGWSAKAGDSIFLKESNSPNGQFSVINVKDPVNPSFAGYIDSIALLAYPTNTLIPAFLKFGVSNSIRSRRAVVNNGQLFLVTSNRIIRYTTTSDFALIDSIDLSGSQSGFGSNIFPLNDSILCLTRVTMNTNYSFVKATASGLALFPETFSSGFSGAAGHSFSNQVNVQGFTDSNTIIITRDYIAGSMQTTFKEHNVYTYDIHSSRLLRQSTSIPFSETENTGYYVSTTKSINLHPSTATELFISDVRDSRGYQTALRNNSVYVDPTIPLDSLKNILLDTLNKRVFLISSAKLTILSYSSTEIGILSHKITNVTPKRFLTVSPLNGSGIKFTLSGTALKRVDLFIYDFSGRMVDKISSLGTNTIYWKSTVHSGNCFVVVAKIGRERIVSRFILKD